jgi:hypothetical protein
VYDGWDFGPVWFGMQLGSMGNADTQNCGWSWNEVRRDHYYLHFRLRVAVLYISRFCGG